MSTKICNILATPLIILSIVGFREATGYCTCTNQSECAVTSESKDIKCTLNSEYAELDSSCNKTANKFIIASKNDYRGRVKIYCKSQDAMDFDYDGELPLPSLYIDNYRNGSAYHMTIATSVGLSGNGMYSIRRIRGRTSIVSFSLAQQLQLSENSVSSARLKMESFKQSRTSSLPLIVCSSNRRLNVQRLVNVFIGNMGEARYKKNCLFGNHLCYHKEEGSFVLCSEYNITQCTCKQMELNPPGGFVSCFNDGKDEFNITKEYFVGLDSVYYFREDLGPLDFMSLDSRTMIRLVSNHSAKKIVAGIPNKFLCNYSPYLIGGSIQWFSLWKNGTTAVLNFSTTEKLPFNDRYRTSIMTAVLDEDCIEIICTGFYLGTGEAVNASLKVQVERGQMPSVSSFARTNQISNANTYKIVCVANGIPKPEITWRRGEEIFSPLNYSRITNSGNENENEARSEIVVDNGRASNLFVGEIRCVAGNELGTDIKTLTIDPEGGQDGNLWYGIIVGVPVTVLVMVSLIILSLCLYFRKPLIGLTKQEIDAFMKGVPNNEVSEKMSYVNIVPESLPYKQELEVPQDRLKIDSKSVLGSGAFGMVLKGQYGKGDVAIKTLKDGASKQELKTLLAELKLMVYIGTHPHVSRLVGAVTKHLSEGKVYLLMEYYSGGSLEAYLRKFRNCYENSFESSRTLGHWQNSRNSMVNPYKNLGEVPATGAINAHRMCLWSYQIADGLDHLSRLKVIHGDLATRNILLADNGHAKISDFGLSRKLYEYTKYVKKSQEPLPWRWMAIESLRDMSFSIESDIWSFGITMWEIYSMADIPYPGMNWSMDFMTELMHGMRLGKPARANQTIYRIMLDCWNLSPSLRPTPAILKEALKQILENQTSKSYDNLFDGVVRNAYL